MPPWPVPSHSADRYNAADLPPFEDKGGEIPHQHVHLDVFVNGLPVVIPAGLGLKPPFASLHTHTDSGIIHLETSDRHAAFKLGQLFTVWGVRLTDACLGGYCSSQRPVLAYINGIRYQGAIKDLPLKSYSQIALAVGEPPRVLPSRYDCTNVSASEARSCEGFLKQGV